MKRLLALTALCLPLYLFAQGFGSFSHDQPFFAVDSAESTPLPGIEPVIDYWWHSGDIASNNPIASWTDRVAGFELTQGNTFYRPTNSSSGVCFDGSKSLDFSTTLKTPTNSSMFVGGYFSTMPHNQIVLYSTNGNDGLYINFTNQIVARFGGANRGLSSAINPSNYMTIGCTLEAVGADTKVTTYINGAAISTNTFTGYGSSIDLVGGWSTKLINIGTYGFLDYSLSAYITDIMVWTNDTLIAENYVWLDALVSTNAATKTPMFDPKSVSGLFSWIRADCPTIGPLSGGPLTNGAPVNYVPEGFNPSAGVDQKWIQGLGSSIWSSNSGPNSTAGMWITGRGFSWNGVNMAYSQPNTYFFVCKSTNSEATPNQCLLDQTTGRQAIYTTFTGPKLSIYAGSLMDYVKPDLANYTILTVNFNDASSWMRTNGVALSSTAGSAGTNSLVNPRIGFDSTSSAGFQGFLSEFLAYNGSLSTNDIATVENYLRTKYGL